MIEKSNTLLAYEQSHRACVREQANSVFLFGHFKLLRIIALVAEYLENFV